MNPEVLNELFISDTGEHPAEVTEFPSSGSNRRYFRIKSMHYTRIGVYGTSVAENQAFVYMSEHFGRQGLPVPQVSARSKDGHFYLQEDLGDTSLFDWLAEARRTKVFGEKERALLKKVICLLPELQVKGAEGMDFGHCYPQAEFNRRSVLWDLNYFKYCFLKTAGIDFQEDRLEDDFDKFADILLAEPSDFFMYRDFQSRNVMLKKGKPYFIDFQGGRKGPVHYDVASFLWQARICYPEELRQSLLSDYLKSLQRFVPVDEEKFRCRLQYFILFRVLQVLGAYGFRGYFERKTHFIESVPLAIANLSNLLKKDFPEFPYLYEVLAKVCRSIETETETKSEELTVHIYSFSYQKGIPTDPSGNGGGFVFDCRATHNPGKYDAYKSLTGLDAPVMRFLEEDGEILPFWEHASALAEASVSRYLERHFTSLTVCFGCTGGQHRSVYCAQRLAEHLHRKFGVRIHLTHREQKKEQYFESDL